MARSLSTVKRRGVETLASLRSDNPSTSKDAGAALIAEARDFGLNLRDFLDLAIDVRGSANPERYADAEGTLSGYEATLSYLSLPVRDDFSRGITLDAAADTFQTFPGTRALFPEVIDDLVRFTYRQEEFEQTAPLVSQSRTISGIEMISTVVDDEEANYQTVRAVAELGRIPVKTIRTTESSVKFYKHGGGYRISYEFQRRARLDLLTPYTNRMARETERSKVWTATNLLVNGDGVHAAAPTVTQLSLDGAAVSGTISWTALLAWLVNMAKAGTPIDTVVGNWDAYIQWLYLFSRPTASAEGSTGGQKLGAAGFQIGGIPILSGRVNFALSSAAPAGKLIGFSRGDTIEELIEAGSQIDESERAIQNQSITYVKSINAGYKMNFGDTRSMLNFNTGS